MKKRILPFIKSITISGIVFVIGYAISIENRIAGTLFLALYSTFMVVRAYRKPIPLGFLTAVLPGLMALFSYSIQSSVMDHGDTDLPMFGLLLGLIPGFIMGIAHRVYPENGRIWAKKSFPYLLLWGISYLVPQTPAAQAPAVQTAEEAAYTPQVEGPLASDANRSAMRNAVSSTPSAETSPATASQSDLDPEPPEPDELEERIRKLDEERKRLASQIAARKKQSEGEQS